MVVVADTVDDEDERLETSAVEHLLVVVAAAAEPYRQGRLTLTWVHRMTAFVADGEDCPRRHANNPMADNFAAFPGTVVNVTARRHLGAAVVAYLQRPVLWASFQQNRWREGRSSFPQHCSEPLLLLCVALAESLLHRRRPPETQW